MRYNSYLYKKTERKKKNTYTDFLKHFNHNHDSLGRFAKRKWGVDYDDPDERYLGDYEVSADDIYRRREDSGSKETDDMEDRGYTYVYDPVDSRDDEFYTQFGNRILDKSFGEDGLIAGYESAGKAFCDHIFETEDLEEIRWADTKFKNEQRRMGEDHIMSLLEAPYDTSKSPEENRSNYEDRLREHGASVLGIGMGAERHPWLDEEWKEEGKRDPDTALNDMARRIADNLADDGYAGMRDFKDIGGNAGVESATILFDKKRKMRL